MRSFWSEPYLWIHLAGLTAVPICLLLCWLGLTVGEPIWPIWLELFLIAAVGIIPIVGMQLFRPFNIFSILIVAVKPEQLNQEQRKILSWFKIPSQRVLAVLSPIFLAGILWKIYLAAPMGAKFIPAFLAESRLAGLLIAAIAFLLANLFLQVPVSVARVLLVSETAYAATQPYPVEKINQDFTTPGLQVNKILPQFSVQNKQSSSS